MVHFVDILDIGGRANIPSYVPRSFAIQFTKKRYLGTYLLLLLLDIHTHSAPGRRPLAWTGLRGAGVASRASQLGQIDVIQELIAADAIELNAQDGNGWTPLMHACARG